MKTQSLYSSNDVLGMYERQKNNTDTKIYFGEIEGVQNNFQRYLLGDFGEINGLQREKEMIKKCEYCGKEFKGRTRSKYCSILCKDQCPSYRKSILCKRIKKKKVDISQLSEELIQKRERKLAKQREYRLLPHVKERMKQFREKNKEEFIKYHKEWRLNNKDKWAEYNKKDYKNNIERIRETTRRYLASPENRERRKKNHREYNNRRRKEDTNFRILDRLQSNLNQMFRLYTKTGKIQQSKRYGINYKSIIEHLKPFPEDLSKYHIDHIRPLCSFKFVNDDNSTNIDEVKKAFAPENHQWLLAEENIRKGGKWNGE